MAMNENLRRMENEQRIIDIKKSFPNDDIVSVACSKNMTVYYLFPYNTMSCCAQTA